MVYQILTDYMDELQKKLNRISKKCQKYGNEFKFSINREYVKNVYENSKTKKPLYLSFTEIEVSGTARINNWEFIATLEIHQQGNIVRRYNTEIELPERFLTSDNVCDHCHSTRQRNNLYVIHNTETDEWKQVGNTCLQDYTNGLSAEYVASYMEAIQLLDNDPLTDDFGDYEPSGKHYYKIEDILCISNVLTTDLGYNKSDSTTPTKSLVSTYLDEINTDKANYYISKWYHLHLNYTDNDFYNDTNYTVVADMIKYFLSLDATSEYIHNIQIYLQEGYTDYKGIGILASLPNSYNKAMEKQSKIKKQMEQKSESKYYGEVGKRYKDIIVSLQHVTFYETQYGTIWIYKMLDNQGNVFIWKTSNCFENGKYSVTGTVKEHKEYNGEQQTELTRCKLTEIK